MFGFIFESLRNQKELKQEELEQQAWNLIDSGNQAAISAFMKQSKDHKYIMQEIYQTYKCFDGDYGRYKTTQDNLLDEIEIIKNNKAEQGLRELEEKYKNISSPEEINSYEDLLEFLFLKVNSDTREKILNIVKSPFVRKGKVTKVAKALEKEGYYDLARVYLSRTANILRQDFAKNTTLEKGLVDIVLKMDDIYIDEFLKYIDKERRKGTLTARKLIKTLKKYGRGDLANMVRDYYNL